ncbi:MAG: hypothetical protein CMJ18_02540 [Phycisphaeraceae bacterium]|nr:hypothetical protein [Phycisphaeraceae bacterium]
MHPNDIQTEQQIDPLPVQTFVLFADDRLAAPRVREEPSIDDTSSWGPPSSDFGCVVSGTTVDDYPPTDYLERANVQTTVRAAWSYRCLWLLIDAEEPDMAAATAFRSPSIHFEHDFRAREDVQVHLDAPFGRDEVIGLSVGIDGRLAQRRTKPAKQRGATAYAQDFRFRWDARVHLRSDGWTANVMIPFVQLDIEPDEGLELGLNVTRNAFAQPAFTTWRGPGYWTIVPGLMGRLVLGGEQVDAPAPAVMMTASAEAFQIAEVPGTTQVTVNDERLTSPDMPFRLNCFENNAIEVRTAAGTHRRSIHVAGDQTLRALDPVEAPDLMACRDALARWCACAETMYAGRGLYLTSRAENLRGLDDSIFRPDLGPEEINYRCSAYMAGTIACMYRLEPRDEFRRRATACLDWLIAQQRADGCLPVWQNRDPFAETSTPVERHVSDCFYEHGNVGRALLDATEAFEAPGFLEAAKQLAGFNLGEPVSHNANYNAFCLIFQPKLSALTGDPRYLDDAIGKYRHGIAPGQLLNGEWTAHNRHTCYMGIIGHGLAELARHLPADDPLRDELRGRLIRLCNCFIARLDDRCGISHPHPTAQIDGDGIPHALHTALSTSEAYGLDHRPFTDRLVRWMITNREHGEHPLSPNIYPELDALARYVLWRHEQE